MKLYFHDFFQLTWYTFQQLMLAKKTEYPQLTLQTTVCGNY